MKDRNSEESNTIETRNFNPILELEFFRHGQLFKRYDKF